MMIREKEAEEGRIVEVAKAMCVAARTAPKAKGVDKLHTAILTGEEKEQLANEMDRIAEELGFGFFHRDANNLRASQAVVLIGEENAVRGLNAGCNFCGMGECSPVWRRAQDVPIRGSILESLLAQPSAQQQTQEWTIASCFLSDGQPRKCTFLVKMYVRLWGFHSVHLGNLRFSIGKK